VQVTKAIAGTNVSPLYLYDDGQSELCRLLTHVRVASTGLHNLVDALSFDDLSYACEIDEFKAKFGTSKLVTTIISKAKYRIDCLQKSSIKEDDDDEEQLWNDGTDFWQPQHQPQISTSVGHARVMSASERCQHNQRVAVQSEPLSANIAMQQQQQQQQQQHADSQHIEQLVAQRIACLTLEHLKALAAQKRRELAASCVHTGATTGQTCCAGGATTADCADAGAGVAATGLQIGSAAAHLADAAAVGQASEGTQIEGERAKRRRRAD
jgi:hypothetical protein